MSQLLDWYWLKPSQIFPLLITQFRKSMSACRCEHELANPDRNADEAASSVWGTRSHSRNDSCVATSHAFCTHHSVCLKCLGLSRFLWFLFQEPPLSDFHLPVLLSFFNGVLFLPENWKYLECAAGLGFSGVSPKPIRVSGIFFSVQSRVMDIQRQNFTFNIHKRIQQTRPRLKSKQAKYERSKSLYFLLVETNRPTSPLYFHTLSALSFPQSPSAPGSARALWKFQETPRVSHLTAPCNLWKGIHCHFVFLRDKQSPTFSQINKMVGKVFDA